MLDALSWLVVNIAMGFVNLFRFIGSLGTIFDFSDRANMVRVIYYGASVEFFFVVFDIFLVLLVAGLLRRPVLWGTVRVLEGFANTVGRFFAWAGLLLVLQQTLIVLLQRFFRVADITISPFGVPFTQSLGWYADELKLYNAAVVALCCAYTFVQGGHVRVDLVYAGLSHAAKRVIDMFGALFFMLPVYIITWMFGWFYLWRNLVTPPINVTDTFEAIERKAGIIRWNVQTISFSPSGFNGYFLFKVLLLCLAAMVIVQAFAFFFRSLAEWLEGPESAGKHHDPDPVGGDAPPAGTH